MLHFKNGDNGVIVKRFSAEHELLSVERFDSYQDVISLNKLEIIYNRHDLLVAVVPGYGVTYTIYPCGGTGNGSN